MKQMLFIIVIGLGLGIGLSKEIEKEVTIYEGTNNRSQFVTIDLEEIGSAVIFNWPPGPAICPAIIYGDFLLEKINPQANTYLIEDHQCQGIAGREDSTVYNFDFIYEVINVHGHKYYLKVLSGDKVKLKIRVSDNLTALSTLPIMKRGNSEISSNEYMINGRIKSYKNRQQAFNPRVYKELTE